MGEQTRIPPTRAQKTGPDVVLESVFPFFSVEGFFGDQRVSLCCFMILPIEFITNLSIGPTGNEVHVMLKPQVLRTYPNISYFP